MKGLLSWLLLVLCLLSTQLVACASPAGSTTAHKHSLPGNNSSPITYSTNSNDVVIRTFYGGGKLGTLEVSPEISIYGDGSYILGPGLQMRQGSLSSASLDQLLHTLVDTDGLLNLNRRQFYDLPDQNATLLQITLSGTYYEFWYGQFGNVQESTQDLHEYHRLGHALTSITQALAGPTQDYQSASMALLVHQDFSPDLTHTIPSWTLPDFTLAQVATYECGPVPRDETGPNADTGCLTFTVPRRAVLLTAQQLPVITSLLHGQQQGEFSEQGLYYIAATRPLLPDEATSLMLAMLGSQQLSYSGVPLHEGAITGQQAYRAL